MTKYFAPDVQRYDTAPSVSIGNIDGQLGRLMTTKIVVEAKALVKIAPYAAGRHMP